MTWVIRKLDGTDYWNNNDGWVEDPKQATIFSNMDKAQFNLPLQGNWVRPLKVKQVPKSKTTGDTVNFYNQVEKFISQHPATDKASKELENLCSRLRDTHPVYADMVSNNKHFPMVLEFAYHLLKLQ